MSETPVVRNGNSATAFQIRPHLGSSIALELSAPNPMIHDVKARKHGDDRCHAMNEVANGGGYLAV